MYRRAWQATVHEAARELDNLATKQQELPHWAAAHIDQPAHLYFPGEPDFLPSAELLLPNTDTPQVLSIHRLFKNIYLSFIVSMIAKERDCVKTDLNGTGTKEFSLFGLGLLPFVSL